MGELVFSYAKEADLPKLCEAESLCFPFEQWGEAALRAHLQSPVCQTLIASRDGAFCGMLLWQAIAPEWEIYRVAVLPSFRRQKIARSLLDFFHETMKQQGCTTGFLEVRAGNEAAISLYEACGYRKESRRSRYYKNPTEDALIFVRNA